MSQTQGADLSGMSRSIKSNVDEYRKRLTAFTLAQSIELEFKESIAPAPGNEPTAAGSRCHRALIGD